MANEQKKFDKMLGLMHTNVLGIYQRAATNAAHLGHDQVSKGHLLLGILALGNSDKTLSIPRVLRDAGCSYEGVLEVLKSEHEDVVKMRGIVEAPVVNDGAVRMFTRARRIAKNRGSHASSTSIVTSDLLIALLTSRDPLLDVMFRGINKEALLKKLSSGYPAKVLVRPNHLRAVS